jgi:hypothetical protein
MSSGLREVDRALEGFEKTNAADPFADEGSVSTKLALYIGGSKRMEGRPSVAKIFSRSARKISKKGSQRLEMILAHDSVVLCTSSGCSRKCRLERDISTWDDIFKKGNFIFENADREPYR